jgi:Bacterial DNA-binding protein
MPVPGTGSALSGQIRAYLRAMSRERWWSCRRARSILGRQSHQILKVDMAPSTPDSIAVKPKKAARTTAQDDKPKPDRARPAQSAAKIVAKTVAKGEEATAAKTKVAAEPGGDIVKLRDIIESVAAATGLKKPDAKKAVDATLAAIGAALAQKSILAVPPLGKLRVAKATAGVMTLKLRLADASRAKELALAEDEEDS